MDRFTGSLLLLMILCWVILLFAPGCANEGKVIEPEKSLLEQVIERETAIKKWAHYCGTTAAKHIDSNKPAEIPGCDTGDATLFNGLLCRSGDMKACTAVAKAQSDTGQWFRSEFYVDKHLGDSFSRDMAKGVLLYLIKTKDTVRAEKWLKFIDKNGLCKDDSDGRCTIVPAFWGLIKVVWEYIGLEPNTKMILGNFGDDTALVASARLTPPGFGLHLEAVNLDIRSYIGTNDTLNGVVAEIMHSRQPDNPYFRWLYEGNSDEVLRSVLGKCSNAQPHRRTQWSWERDTAERAWEDSMGHECLFMFNLIQGK